MGRYVVVQDEVQAKAPTASPSKSRYVIVPDNVESARPARPGFKRLAKNALTGENLHENMGMTPPEFRQFQQKGRESILPSAGALLAMEGGPGLMAIGAGLGETGNQVIKKYLPNQKFISNDEANFGINPLTDPIARTAATVYGVSKVAAAIPAIIPAVKRAANSDIAKTLFRRQSTMDADILAANVAAEKGSIDVSNKIRKKAPAINAQNSSVYGRALDDLDLNLTRGDIEAVQGQTLDDHRLLAERNPSLLEDPAYMKAHRKLLAQSEELASNTEHYNSAMKKKADQQRDKVLKARGEFYDVNADYSLTPQESKALRNHRHASDKISAAELQGLRRDLRANSGKTSLSNTVVNDFERNMGLRGEVVNPDLQDLISLNKEYGPVLTSKNQALRDFPQTNTLKGPEAILKISKDAAEMGQMSPIDAEYLDPLLKGSGRFAGLGTDIEEAISGVTASQQRAARMAKMKKIQANIRRRATVAAVSITGASAAKKYGLF